MVVEDGPLYSEWRVALERLIEAHKRHVSARGTKNEELCRRDLEAAQAALTKISSQIDA